MQVNAATVTVGPAGCDYTTIQDAIDAELPGFPTVRIVQGVYDGELLIDMSEHDSDLEVSLVGGFANCNDASSNIRLEGSVSTISGNDSTYGIKLINDELSQSLIQLQGIKITNGLYKAMITNSGGLDVRGNIELSLIESEISDSEGVYGGGIYADEHVYIYIRDSRISNNTAFNGGGVFCQGCYIRADKGTGIVDNDSTQFGGGIYAENDSTVNIYSGSAYPEITHLGIHGNTANYGGGIYAIGASVRMAGYSLSNSSGTYGDDENPVSLSNNSAQSEGGGIYATDESSLNLANINVVDNEAGVSGGGIQISESSHARIWQVLTDQPCWNHDKSKCNRFVNNRIANGSDTNGSGGAIKVDNSSVSIKHTWFEGNDAGGEGNGSVISIVGADVASKIDNSVFFNNGYVTGSDNSIFHILTASISMQHITAVDNIFDNAVFFTFGGPAAHLYQFELFNSIIHNSNGDDVLQQIQPPDTDIGCVLVHDDDTLPNNVTNMIEGNPMFVNREGGSLQLTSDSEWAIDKCQHFVPFGFRDLDIIHNSRFVDLEGFLNVFGESDYADMGAFEYPGYDDLIFKNRFD